MSKIIKAFYQFIVEIKSDMMLLAIIMAPILTGIVFKFLLPVLEKILCEHFEAITVLSPYYLIFDLLLLLVTPMMFAFSGIMVILSEIDNGISSYMMVTPLGKGGYLCSRIILPTIIAVFFNVVIISIFSLTDINIIMAISLSIMSGLMSIITSLLVVTIASNKVEGMVMAKLSGLLNLGLPVAFFVRGPMEYLVGMLPSFWFSKLAITEHFYFAVPTIFLSLLWIVILYRRFERKIA